MWHIRAYNWEIQCKLVTKVLYVQCQGAQEVKYHFESTNNSEIAHCNTTTPDVTFNIVNNGCMHLENLCIP